MENCVDIEKFEDTRRGKSKKDRQYNDYNAMDKETSCNCMESYKDDHMVFYLNNSILHYEIILSYNSV